MGRPLQLADAYRSRYPAAFPLFTTPMYRNLGVHWASAVPGFLALLCLPFPFLFYKYGASIRARCKYTKLAEETMKEMMQGSPDKTPKPTEKQEQAADRADAQADNYPVGSNTNDDETSSDHTLGGEANNVGSAAKRKPST